MVQRFEKMHSDKLSEHTYLVIMAGGIGSRFWPMSTPDNPKQFHDILGMGKTLFQETVGRFKSIVPVQNIYVVTSGKYVPLVQEQEPDIPEKNILAEPMRRNTAPCIAYAAYAILDNDPDAIMIVTPADHYVSRPREFRSILTKAVDWLRVHDQALMTMGIAPDRPETGYGYIQTAGFAGKEIVPVIRFKEKPDAETALEYFKSGDYLWNSGIFLWKASTIIAAFKEHLPEVDTLFSQVDVNAGECDDLYNTYQKSPNISIDYGILERASNIHVVRADCGWSDLGTWGSLWQQEKHDADGNSVAGKQTYLYETKNCVIRVPVDKQVVIEGLEDYIVVDDKNHLLIFRKENEQLIGTYSKQISEQ